ncbi:MAG: DUF1987 domain-containing protein [Vicingaceae bacterium]|nr:DUF1987 domain-containing protein [Vicingaceae bacterium]
MKKLFIEETNKTPEIDFNLEKGILSISGVSVPENAHDFYFPIIIWLKENIAGVTNSTIEFSCKILYLNTSSLQFLSDIFFAIETISSPSKEVLVNWYYDKYDTDMKETGIDFKDIVSLNFNLIAVE